MSKKARTILFIICVCLFFATAPAVILYSQGFRFDFEGKKIVQTGALYFKVSPRSAEVYLNNKLKTKTSMITGSVLIETLMPKTYQVKIKKEGYYPWQKNLEIKEAQVTEAKNIVLIPKNSDFTLSNQKAEEISEIVSEIAVTATSSDEKKVIESNNYEIWILFLEEKEKIFLTRFSEKIGNVFWLTDHYLIFNVGNKIKVAEIDNRDRINMFDLAEFEKPEIFWSKKDRKLYVLSEEGIYISENLLP